MSLFGRIMDKIFHHPAAAAAKPAAPAQAAPAAAPSAPQVPTTAATQAPVDVEAVLTAMAAEHGGGGNWQTSIIDLLKLLDLDSSLGARKDLADELNVHVGADGTAEENIALHKAVMAQLAANGGKVPDSLR
ncbi:MAG: DUF3597 domain-containing protein [Sphingomonadaceae bacterium]|nr:DUF3597 domain-containing protein [Sphingomonadaceae bacterium]